MKKVVLASESPRRRELLSSVDINFITCAPRVEEVFDTHLSIEKAIQEVALCKARGGQARYPHDIVIGADSVVVIDQVMLGKPKSDEEAYAMLKMLSGRTHSVYSGVAFVHEEDVYTFCEETKVTFYELSEEMLQWYIATKESRDKAGAYGIQGKGSLLVKRIEGDYYNVVGLPLAKVYRTLMKYI